MQEIIIRTNFNSKIGLGHLFRTKILAKNCEQQKYKIIYALDYKVENKNLLNYEYFYLYSKNKKFTDQTEDAKILNEKIKQKKVKYIIVDDYRFNNIWEKFFYQKGKKLIVFDDYCQKKHLCDFIINSKWSGIGNLEQEYKNLVPKKCKKLLGPKYSIINPNLKKKKHISKKLNLLFYFGGGGNFNDYNKVIISFCSKIKKNKLKNKVHINIIIGPLAINYGKLKILAKKNDFVNLFENTLDLSVILKKTSIFFGTSSSIVNELNYLNIPSCLFSTSDNPRQNFKYREDYGQFLYFDKNELIHVEKITHFLLILIKNYKRIRNLCNKKKIFIDKKGTKRIIQEINKPNYINAKKKLNKSFFSEEILGKIYPVKDTLINEYLDSRNLRENRKNSLNTNYINKIDHYIWWFTTKRQSFYLLRKKKIRLFLSQELVTFKKNFFWAGGWFNSKNKCNILDIMQALKWQLKNSKKIYNCPWIVIIKKTNKAVFKINRYLGYQIVSKTKDRLLYQTLKSFYNINKSQNYFFLKK